MGEAVDITNFLQFVLALLATVGLIIGAGWAAKRYNLTDRLIQARSGRRLAVSEQLMIDGNSKLVLVRCDDAEHLILLQRQGAVVVNKVPAGVPTPAPGGNAPGATP